MNIIKLMSKKSFIFTLLLAFMMETLIQPIPYARAAGTFSGGSGTINDPYTIKTVSQLNEVRNNLDKNFKLAADLDFTGMIAWTPIGNSSTQPFTGSFDGAGHRIKAYNITASTDTEAGLFSRLGNGSQVKNIILADAVINVTNGNPNLVGALAGANYGLIANIIILNSHISGPNQVGALIGSNETAGTVNNSQVWDSEVQGFNIVGGLVGNNKGTAAGNMVKRVKVSGATTIGGLAGENNGGSINKSSYISNSANPVSSTGINAGGLVGSNTNGGIIGSSYAEGTVGVASSSGHDNIGGLVGYNNGAISNSYAKAAVTGASKVGGFIGKYTDGALTNTYAAGTVSSPGVVGGYLGEGTSSVVISSSYWDSTLANGFNAIGSGSVSGSLTGKSTSEMQTQSTYSSWNFSQIWKFNSNSYLTLLNPLNNIEISEISAANTAVPFYFNPMQLDYTVYVGDDIQSIKVSTEIAIALDTFQVGNVAQAANVVINLSEDSTEIPVTVSRDSTPIAVYHITVLKVPVITTIPYAGLTDVPLKLPISIDTALVAYDSELVEGDLLKITFPAGYVLPDEEHFNRFYISVNGKDESNGSLSPYINYVELNADERWVKIGLDEDISAGSQLMVVFSSLVGIGNPATPGVYTFHAGVDGGASLTYSVTLGTASSVSDFRVSSSDNYYYNGYNGEFENDYTLSFKPTAALAAGDVIRIKVPDGYKNTSSGYYAYWNPLKPVADSSVFDNGSLIAGNATGYLDEFNEPYLSFTLGSGALVNPGNTVTIQLNNYMRNPDYSGEYVFRISTNKDQMPVDTKTAVIAEKVADFEVVPSSRVVGEANVPYTFSFTSMAPISVSNEIYIKLPYGIVSGQASSSSFLVNEVPVNSAAIIERDANTGSILRIDPGQTNAIDSFKTVKITVSANAGFRNPAAIGFQAFELKTTDDLAYKADDKVYYHNSNGSAVSYFEASYDVGEFNNKKLRFYLENDIALKPPADFIQIIIPGSIGNAALDLQHVSLTVGESRYTMTSAVRSGDVITIYVPEHFKFSVGDGTSIVSIPMLEALAAGTSNFQLTTSKQLLPAADSIFIADNKLRNFTISRANIEVAANSQHEFNFTTNMAVSSNDRITLEYPANMSIPQNYSGVIRLNGNIASYERYNSHTLVVIAPSALNANEAVIITVPTAEGFSNPNSTSANTFRVRMGMPNEMNGQDYASAEVFYVNRTALLTAISNAGIILNAAHQGTQAGQYAAADINVLESSITAATGVANSSYLTQAMVDNAVANMNSAVDLFKSKVVGTPAIFAEAATVNSNSEIIVTFRDAVFFETLQSAPPGISLTNTAVALTGGYRDPVDYRKIHLSLSGPIVSASEVKVLIQASAVKVAAGVANSVASSFHVFLASEINQLRTELLAEDTSTNGKIRITNVIRYYLNRFATADKKGAANEDYLRFILRQIDSIQ